MKLATTFFFIVLIAGCASDPLLTGKPQDWKGRPASQLEMAWGPPTRRIQSSDKIEVWEYVKSGDFVAPKREDTSFRVGGGSGAGMFGASGGITTLKHDERLSRYENIWRFKIKNGKVVGWYAARLEDGRIVWQDQ
jgi:hypothetical protein